MNAKPAAVPEWNPRLSYVWTRKQVRAWLDCYGERAFYDGGLWAPVVKHIACGRYSVTFRIWSPA